MRRRRRIIALTLATLLVLAACGGDDDDSSDTTAASDATQATETTAAPAEQPEVEIVLAHSYQDTAGMISTGLFGAIFGANARSKRRATSRCPT